MEFAVEGCARMGLQATKWRSRVCDAIRSVGRATAPLDRYALRHRSTRLGQGWRPVFTAVWISLLDWKDRALP
eukprot:8761733-Lingulodinium_polyedra.AAC.1